MAKKPTTKKPVSKKPTAKKPTAKKPTAKKGTPSKKPTTKKTTVKKPVSKVKETKKFEIPTNIEKLLKLIKVKYYKDISVKEFKKTYKEEFIKIKEEYKKEKWSDMIFHKKTFTAIKNKKKRESLGGAVEPFVGIIFGAGKVRDLSEKRRNETLDKWKKDPLETINENLILTRTQKNPQTGEIQKIPIQNSDGEIVPVDNREFFERKDGSKWKNQNYGLALPHSYIRTVIGVCMNNKNIKGVFILELRDKQTEISVPIYIPIKFTTRLIGTDILKWEKNEFISEELITTQIEYIGTDMESGIIDNEYADEKLKLLTDLLEGTDEEIVFYKLRSTKSTSFIELEEEEIKEIDFLKKKDGSINIDLLYRKYFRNFICDSAHLLDYHEKNRYIDGDPNKVNWDEIVSLCDVNLIQINMELSLAGNYTMYIEDDSMLYYNIVQNDETIDSIKLIVPGHIKIDFGQDSKLNIIGNPVQFQSQDDNRDLIFEDDVDEEGKPIKVPVFDYPMVMVYGIYAIPEYKVEIEEIDLTEAIEIDVDKLLEPKEVEIGYTTSKTKTNPEEELEEESDEELEEESDDKESIEEESDDKKPAELLEDEATEGINEDDIW